MFRLPHCLRKERPLLLLANVNLNTFWLESTPTQNKFFSWSSSAMSPLGSTIWLHRHVKSHRHKQQLNTPHNSSNLSPEVDTTLPIFSFIENQSLLKDSRIYACSTTKLLHRDLEIFHLHCSPTIFNIMSSAKIPLVEFIWLEDYQRIHARDSMNRHVWIRRLGFCKLSSQHERPSSLMPLLHSPNLPLDHTLFFYIVVRWWTAYGRPHV